MDPVETLETEISRLIQGVARHKRFINVATSRVSSMEEDLLEHREALEKLKKSLAKIGRRDQKVNKASPPMAPLKPPSARASQAQTEQVRHKTPNKRRSPRVQIKVYKDTYLTGTYKVPGIETNVGLAVHIIREAGEAGVTKAELLERSAQYRDKPLDWQCIGSQLHEMIKRGVVRKEGGRYVAN